MNPFDVLSADHSRLLDLSNQLTGGVGDPLGSTKEQRRAAEHLVMEGSKHEAIEEQCFWPLVRDRLDGGGALAVAGIQHEVRARSLLHELNRVQPGGDTFMTLVFTTASHIRDHLTYEESQVWPKLQLALDSEELERLGTQLHQAKRTAPTRPHPHTPPDARLLRTVGPLTGLVDRALDRLTMRGR